MGRIEETSIKLNETSTEWNVKATKLLKHQQVGETTTTLIKEVNVTTTTLLKHQQSWRSINNVDNVNKKNWWNTNTIECNIAKVNATQQRCWNTNRGPRNNTALTFVTTPFPNVEKTGRQWILLFQETCEKPVKLHSRRSSQEAKHDQSLYSRKIPFGIK